MKTELKLNERPPFDFDEGYALKTEAVYERLYSEIREQEEKIFTDALRTMAEPPIKGKITNGKLKWRGIRLARQRVGFDQYSWIEQRGKQISPTFHITSNLSDPAK